MPTRAKQRVLVAEADQGIGESICHALDDCGRDVIWVKTGAQAIRESTSQHYEAMILNLALPDIDGFEVLDTIRKNGCLMPILFVSHDASSQDRTDGINAGADDYLSKPFDYDELRARINALLRRKNPGS